MIVTKAMIMRANTMRGEYRGVQKRIKDVSEHAKFV